MTEYSKRMTTYMDSLSELTENELEMLAQGAAREIECRKNRQRKADINNAIVAIQKLFKHFNSLEIEAYVDATGEVNIVDIELIDIESALKALS